MNLMFVFKEIFMKKLMIILVLLGIASVPLTAFGQCSIPKALIVLDKSSSMTGTIGGETKWSLAVTAIETLVNDFDGQIDFGLMIYPGTNHCTTGTVVVDVGPGNVSAILAALSTPPPTGGNYTPMYQSLDAVASYTTLQSTDSSNYVIFLTDGWQWCDPPDWSTTGLAVGSVEDLALLNIKTAVIGFSASVDKQTLQRMAIEGGIPHTTCDSNITDLADISELNRCYFQTDDGQSLASALQAIAVTITAEECNNADDNCDGNIDENLYRSCSNDCGSGIELCSEGEWDGCTAPPVLEEICNDVDDDCNGVVDDGVSCTCTIGATRLCGFNEGACEFGYQSCVEIGGKSMWTECTEAVWGSAERCNDVDDDCDGEVDENLVQTCETICGAGAKTCVDGSWSGCTAQIPAVETCNGVDDDCDGVVDNGDNLCPDGRECVNGFCQTTDATDDPGTDDGTGSSSAPDGCSCQVGSGSNTPDGLIFFIFGFAVLFMAFRKRKF
jgi:von Willebrand factor type A domain/Putative metal-binding motif